MTKTNVFVDKAIILMMTIVCCVIVPFLDVLLVSMIAVALVVILNKIFSSIQQLKSVIVRLVSFILIHRELALIVLGQWMDVFNVKIKQFVMYVMKITILKTILRLMDVDVKVDIIWILKHNYVFHVKILLTIATFALIQLIALNVMLDIHKIH